MSSMAMPKPSFFRSRSVCSYGWRSSLGTRSVISRTTSSCRNPLASTSRTNPGPATSGSASARAEVLRKSLVPGERWRRADSRARRFLEGRPLGTVREDLVADHPLRAQVEDRLVQGVDLAGGDDLVQPVGAP